jgi:hypothetical protein
MSRQFRYRVPAIVLSGLFLGVLLLTNGTASAQQLDAADRRITFAGGGILTFSCESRPDADAMTVPAGSAVRVVNRTGHPAKLRLSGVTKGSLADDAATDVVFRRGTTSLRLEPDCALGDDATPVQITAAAPTPVTVPVTMSNPLPVPVDLPSLRVPLTEPSQVGGPRTPTTSAPGLARPDAALPVRPHRTKPSIGRPRTNRPDVNRPQVNRPGVNRPQANRPGVDRPRANHPSVDRPRANHPSVDKPRANRPDVDRSRANRPPVRHAAAGAHPAATSGWPPRGKPQHAATPGRTKPKVKAGTGTGGGRAGGVLGPGGVPRLDVTPMAAGARPSAGAAPQDAASQSAAAEPATAIRPVPDASRIGLLGMIAAVCAGGVIVAAIRSIVSERANRPIVA